MAGGLAAQIRAKAPGKYDNIPDDVLESVFMAKYPQLASQKAALDMPTPPDPIKSAPDRSLLGSEPIGALKGIGAMGVDTANMFVPPEEFQPPPGYSTGLSRMSKIPMPSILEPGEGEKVGYYGAQAAPAIAELPAAIRGGGRMLMKGADSLLSSMTPGKLKAVGVFSPRLRSGLEWGQDLLGKVKAAKSALAEDAIPAVTKSAEQPDLFNEQDMIDRVQKGMELPRAIKQSPTGLGDEELLNQVKGGMKRPPADIATDRRALRKINALGPPSGLPPSSAPTQLPLQPPPTTLTAPELRLGQLKQAIEAGGGVDKGAWEDLGVHMFDDPQTGSTLAMKAEDITPESVAQHIAESRAKFAKLRAPDALTTTPALTSPPDPLAGFGRGVVKKSQGPLMVGKREVPAGGELQELIRALPPKLKKRGIVQ